MIKFTNVTKKFPGGVTALCDASFEIKDGEFVFLVGTSGSGKTTIFKLILKILTPTQGEIIVDEHLVPKINGAKLVELRRKVGIVFQDLRLLEDRSVFDNIALSLWVLGKNEKEIADEVREKLALVGLEEKADYFPKQLSGGELQRVAIARAISGDPKYLLADEPTGNVDDANAWKIVKILNKINKKGTTVIMATHNGEIIETLNKRVIEIREGHIKK